MRHTLNCLLLTLSLLFIGIGNVWGTKYKLVTSTSELVAGCKYIIGSAKTGEAVFMSNAPKTNNRDATKKSYSIDNDYQVELTEDMLVLLLEGSNDAWTFFTSNYEGNSGYLNPGSTETDNYLKILTDNPDYRKFSITLTDKYDAIITCTGKKTRNVIQFNEPSSLFSCYNSTQKPVYLYKEVVNEDVIYEQYTGTLTEGDYVIVSDGGAMKNTITNNRFGISNVTIIDSKITNPIDNIVWHIAPTTEPENWTIYNKLVKKYASGAATENKVTLLDDHTSNFSLWNPSEYNDGTYDFVNIGRENKNHLYRNQDYGFSCYAEKTGKPLHLYKRKVSNTLHTIVWSVNRNTDLVTTVSEGENIIFPTPTSNIPEGYEFMGWVAKDFGGVSNTAPIYAPSATMGTCNLTYYAVFAHKNDVDVKPTFDASIVSTNDELSWTQDGITLKLSAGRLYTNGSPKTFTITNGTDNYFSISSNEHNLRKITAEVTSTNYKIGSVTNGSLTTNGTIQVITPDANTKEVKGYATSGYQIRIKTIEVEARTTTYSDYCTYVNTSINTPTFEFNPTSIVTTLGETFTLPTLSNNSNGDVTFSSDNIDVATVNEDGAVTIYAAGWATITASVTETENFYSATASYKITVNKKTATLSFPKNEYTVDINADFQEPELTKNPADAEITYSSNNGNVATVDANSGEITLKGEGTTIITATFHGNDTYKEASATYVLNVIDNTVKTYVYKIVRDVIDLSSGTFIIVNKPVNDSRKYYAMGWQNSYNRDVSEVNRQGDYIHISQKDIATAASNTNDGKVREFTINYENNLGSIYDRVEKGYLYQDASDNSNKNNLKTEIASTPSDKSLANISISGNIATISFSREGSTQYIGFNKDIYACYNSNTSAYQISIYKKVKSLTLDEAKEAYNWGYEGPYDHVTVKRVLKAEKWNTLCLPFAMSEDDIKSQLGDDAEVMELASVKLKDTGWSLKWSQQSTMTAGKMYMVRVHKDIEQIDVYKDVQVNTKQEPEASEWKDEEGNTIMKAQGNYNYTIVPPNEGCFVIKDNLFYYVDSKASLKGFRGYLQGITNDGAPVHAMTFEFITEDEDATTSLSDLPHTIGNTMYDICGRVVTRPTRGLYIHNGKKIFIK